MNLKAGKQYEELADSEIWSQFCLGVESAFEYIYTSNFERLYNYGCQFTPNTSLVEDAIQELFIDLRRRSLHLSPTNKILPYLYAAFRRKIIRLRDKESRNQEFEENKSFEITLSVEDKIIKEDIEKEDLQKLRLAVASLTPRHRNADWGDNFYYQGFLTDVPAGEYIYTFRFQLDDGPYKYAGTDGLWNGTSSVNKAFTVNSVTSVTSDEFQTPSVHVYPNPVTNGVINLELNNLEAGEYDFILIDITGRVLQNNKLMCSSGTNTFHIPTTAAKGIYLFQLSSIQNARKLNMKIIIE